MAAVYAPQIEWLVRTTPLPDSILGAILLLALSVVLTVEVDKHLLRRARLPIRNEDDRGMMSDT
jgi:hypothetical protein